MNGAFELTTLATVAALGIRTGVGCSNSWTTGVPSGKSTPIASQPACARSRSPRRRPIRSSAGAVKSSDSLSARKVRSVPSSSVSSAIRNARTRSRNCRPYASRWRSQKRAVMIPAKTATGKSAHATSRTSCVRNLTIPRRRTLRNDTVPMRHTRRSRPVNIAPRSRPSQLLRARALGEPGAGAMKQAVAVSPRRRKASGSCGHVQSE